METVFPQCDKVLAETDDLWNFETPTFAFNFGPEDKQEKSCCL